MTEALPNLRWNVDTWGAEIKAYQAAVDDHDSFSPMVPGELSGKWLAESLSEVLPFQKTFLPFAKHVPFMQPSQHSHHRENIHLRIVVDSATQIRKEHGRSSIRVETGRQHLS